MSRSSHPVRESEQDPSSSPTQCSQTPSALSDHELLRLAARARRRLSQSDLPRRVKEMLLG